MLRNVFLSSKNIIHKTSNAQVTPTSSYRQSSSNQHVSWISQLLSKNCLQCINLNFLGFKLSPCPECCILSFGWFHGVWILRADVSKHCLFHLHRRYKQEFTPPLKMEQTKRSETSANKIQTTWNHQKERIQQI